MADMIGIVIDAIPWIIILYLSYKIIWKIAEISGFVKKKYHRLP